MKRWFSLGCVFTILLTGLTACGEGAFSAKSVTPPSVITVQMTLTDLSIQSSLTTFAKGVPYHFIITNKSSKEHEFLLGPLIEPGMTMNDVEKEKLFGVGGVAAGATTSTNFTFKSLAAWGVWEFSCHVGTLYEAGMRLEMVVV